MFGNSTVTNRNDIEGLSYPIATYFIDEDVNLIGMMKYSLSDPGRSGLNVNRIEVFYLTEDIGIPLAKLKKETR